MNRAKQIRLDRGSGVLEVAEGAGISTKTLHKIEAGRDVGAAALARLGKYYELRPTDLLAPASFSGPLGEAAA